MCKTFVFSLNKLPSLSKRKTLEEKLSEWEKYCEELANYVEFQFNEAYDALYQNPDDKINRNWYAFAGGLRGQLKALIRQYKSELNDLDYSDSEDALVDRLNEITIYLSTRFNPSTMNFLVGALPVTPETASNVAAALAIETRSDVLSTLQQRREELVQSRLNVEKDNLRKQQLLTANRAVAADLEKAKKLGQRRKEAAGRFEEVPVMPPPTKKPQDMTKVERQRYRAMHESAKKNISHMEEVGEKRVIQTLDRINKPDIFGSATKAINLPSSQVATPISG